MKTILAIAFFVCSFSLQAQDMKKLVLTTKTGLNKTAAVYIDPIDKDRSFVVDHLRNSLGANGFKLVTDRKEATYVINIKYADRADTGCGGSVIKTLDGQIFDAKNGAEVVATFTFKQSAFEGKCSTDIMSVLAKKINQDSKSN